MIFGGLQGDWPQRSWFGFSFWVWRTLCVIFWPFEVLVYRRRWTRGQSSSVSNCHLSCQFLCLLLRIALIVLARLLDVKYIVSGLTISVALVEERNWKWLLMQLAIRLQTFQHSLALLRLSTNASALVNIQSWALSLIVVMFVTCPS